MNLTASQKRLLARVPKAWADMSVGCTNPTLGALEKRGLVETRISKYIPFGFSQWQWRKSVALDRTKAP